MSSDINAVRRLGYTRVILTSAQQFNSLFLRAMTGLGNWLLPETISVITSIEFFLNFILEIPFGIVADKSSRFRLVVAGISLIALSLVFTALSTIQSLSTNHAYYFLVCTGVLIGLGKPMYSGALEAFYQKAIIKHQLEKSDNSFAHSNFYGRYLTTGIAIFTMLIIFICLKLDSLYVGFASGIALYLFLMLKIQKDHKAFKAHDESHTRVRPDRTQSAESVKFSEFFKANLTFGYALNFYFFFNGTFVLNYFIATISREQNDTNAAYFLAGSFILGYLSLGWILKSMIIPKIAKSKNFLKYIPPFTLFFSVVSLLINYFYQGGAIVTRCCLAFAYGVFVQVFLSLIKDASTNWLFSHTRKEAHSTVLSVANVPGYFIAAVVPFYYSVTGISIPSSTEILNIVGFSAPVAAMVFFLFTMARPKTAS